MKKFTIFILTGFLILLGTSCNNRHYEGDDTIVFRDITIQVPNSDNSFRIQSSTTSGTKANQRSFFATTKNIVAFAVRNAGYTGLPKNYNNLKDAAFSHNPLNMTDNSVKLSLPVDIELNLVLLLFDQSDNYSGPTAVAYSDKFVVSADTEQIDIYVTIQPIEEYVDFVDTFSQAALKKENWDSEHLRFVRKEVSNELEMKVRSVGKRGLNRLSVLTPAAINELDATISVKQYNMEGSGANEALIGGVYFMTSGGDDVYAKFSINKGDVSYLIKRCVVGDCIDKGTQIAAGVLGTVLLGTSNKLVLTWDASTTFTFDATPVGSIVIDTSALASPVTMVGPPTADQRYIGVHTNPSAGKKHLTTSTPAFRHGCAHARSLYHQLLLL